MLWPLGSATLQEIHQQSSYYRVGKALVSEYNSNITPRIPQFILNNSRSKARAIVGALTGHYATGTIKLTLDPGCRACGEEEETMEHLYCVTAMSWWVNVCDS